VLPDSAHLTTGDLTAHFGVAAWQIRRAVDALGLAIPRAGLYRLVPRDLLPQIEAELRRRGWLREEVSVAQ
jgi:hypothetical protein